MKKFFVFIFILLIAEVCLLKTESKCLLKDLEKPTGCAAPVIKENSFKKPAGTDFQKNLPKDNTLEKQTDFPSIFYPEYLKTKNLQNNL